MVLTLGVGMALGAGPTAPQDPPATKPSAAPASGDAPAELPADFGTAPPVPAPTGKAGDQLGPEPTSAGRSAPAAEPAAKPSLPGALGKLLGKAKDQAKAAETGQAPRDESLSRTQQQVPTAAGANPVALPEPVTIPNQAAPPASMPIPLPAAADPGPAAAMPPPRDLAVEPTQAAGTPAVAGAQPAVPSVTEASPLPPAGQPPAGAPAAAPATVPNDGRARQVLTAEELQLGRQSIGLVVDVIAPQVLNLSQTANFKIAVRNNGKSDARGVVVRDLLPDGLSFVSSQPEAQQVEPSFLVWNLETVPAGSEKLITLTVKPTKVGSYDHAATVTMATGARSQTIVRAPKLKVEATVPPGKILKGQPIPFTIAVTNPGDGPARNVTVQAKLSPGLKYMSGELNEQNLLEQTIDLINPGQRVELDKLVVDAIAGGEQTCTVAVSSPDVVAGAPEARSVQTVTVVEPKLKLTLTGPETRHTDMLATYEIALENPGTSPAQNLRVQATIPVSTRLYQLPSGARFDPNTRRLSWVRPALQPGAKDVLSFQVRMGGVGQIQIGAEARADNVALAKEMKLTDVTGLADVDVSITEKRRVVDVDEQTTYIIKVTNAGTKEATRLQVSAKLTPNLEPVETSGTDAKVGYNPAEHELKFPLIERLSPNKSIELAIRVKVVNASPRIATCRVFVKHDELGDADLLEDVAAFKIPQNRR